MKERKWWSSPAGRRSSPAGDIHGLFCVTMMFLWCSYDFLLVSYGVRVAFLWFSYGFFCGVVVVFFWLYYGFLVVCLWLSYCFIVVNFMMSPTREIGLQRAPESGLGRAFLI